ncbi:MAG: hypothetical protein WCL70_08590 [Paludibacter sp.]
MDFTEQKRQIIAQMKRGDKKAIALRASVSTVTVWSALGKSSINEMTEAEKTAWIATVEYINERQNGNDKIEKQTSKLAGRL